MMGISDGRTLTFFRAVCVALAIVAAPVVAVHPALSAAQPPAAQDDFVPIDQLPQDEQLPAAPLVMSAYAVAWLAVFGYLWSIWRRLGRVEREMAEVSRRVAAQGERR